MRDYELTWILKDKMDDELMDKSVESVKLLIADFGGELVSKVTDYGLRNLAYEIKGDKRGHYFMLRFSLDPSKAQEMERKIFVDQNIIRHLMIIINRFDLPVSPDKLDEAPVVKNFQKPEIPQVKIK